MRRRRRRRGRSLLSRSIRAAKRMDRMLATKRRVTTAVLGSWGSPVDITLDTPTHLLLQPTFQRGTGAAEGDFTGSAVLVTKLRLKGLLKAGSSQVQDSFVRVILIKCAPGDVPFWDDAGPPVKNEILEENVHTVPTPIDFRSWSPQPKYKILFDKVLKVPGRQSTSGHRYVKYINWKIPMNIKYQVDTAGTLQTSMQYRMSLVSDVVSTSTNLMPNLILHGRYTYADMS